MVAVLVLTGSLCTEGSALYTEELPHFGDLVQQLLGRTYVGIWSRMNTIEVQDLVMCILPENLVFRLSFVLGCDSVDNMDPHPDRNQFFGELFSRSELRDSFLNHVVVFIDVDPLNPQSVSITYPRVRISGV